MSSVINLEDYRKHEEDSKRVQFCEMMDEMQRLGRIMRGMYPSEYCKCHKDKRRLTFDMKKGTVECGFCGGYM